MPVLDFEPILLIKKNEIRQKPHASHGDTSMGAQRSIPAGFARNKENANKVQIPSETSTAAKNTSY